MNGKGAGVDTYMVLDDLVGKPMSTISSIALLNQFSVKNVGVLKEKAVTLGMNEALMLLKTSLQSKNVLATGVLGGVFCSNRLVWLNHHNEFELCFVVLQNVYSYLGCFAYCLVLICHNKVQHYYHVPVVSVLGWKFTAGAIIANSRLALSLGFSPPKEWLAGTEDTSTCDRSINTKLDYVAPPGGLVKGVVTYLVLDDLVVKPMSIISSIILLKELGIKDVGGLKERVVTLGLDEALKLLKFSLQSKSVLTSVFMDNMKDEYL
ncbi:hypothetical protein P3S68_013218 [Capsicum galapagoense]